MQHFAVGRKRDGAGFVDGLANFVTANFTRAIENNSTMSIDPAHVRTCNSEDCVLDREAGSVFGLLHGLLNGRDRFLEVDDNALTRASRIGEAVTAVAQAIVGDLNDKHAGLGASYIDGGQKMLVRLRHD